MWSASAICLPIVCTGLSADSGSWNTIAMSLPRYFDISLSFRSSKLTPLYEMEPVIDALSASRPIIDNDITVLPEPDSPTMPSTSPARMSSDTSRTARTMPASLGNVTERLRISMRLRCALAEVI